MGQNSFRYIISGHFVTKLLMTSILLLSNIEKKMSSTVLFSPTNIDYIFFDIAMCQRKNSTRSHFFGGKTKTTFHVYLNSFTSHTRHSLNAYLIVSNL